MLKFIFKYTWLAILVIAYTIWTFVSIKEIKDDSKKWSPSAEAWIVVTISSIILIVAVIFVTSFTYWLCCIG
jgi:heme/copper-type cytochrome/quinol oxidase subunit 2